MLAYRLVMMADDQGRLRALLSNYGMSISIDKTEVMAISKGETQCDIELPRKCPNRLRNSCT